MNLDHLPPPAQRRFVPHDVKPTDWAAVEPLFLALEQRPLHTVDDLVQWLDDQFELRAVLRQASAVAYIDMTCDTENAEAEQAFLHITQNIDPACKPHWHALDERLLDHPAVDQLPARYAVFLKKRRNERALYREANVALEAEESRLDQRHEKIKGAQSTVFDGKEQTLIQVAAYLERADREIRQKAFTAVVQRRRQDREALDDVFDRLLEVRGEKAKNAGFSNFRDYQHQRLDRFDYTPDDCLAFHEAVEQCVGPAVAELAERRRKSLGLDVLKPWDLDCDAQGLPPLAPFVDAEQLAAGCGRVLDRLDPELGAEFDALRKNGLLDLANRKGKAPGGYQESLDEHRLPFIFMNAVGLDGDVRTLLHEAGHAFHTFAVRDEPVYDYRMPPIEFCEVASMSMELLANDHLDAVYTEEDVQRSRLAHLENVVWLLPWIASIDAFQHWLYTHPGHSRAQRGQAWLDVRRRFRGPVDWSGFEEDEAYLWQKQGHLYSVPFYYIEYGIAQLGALGVWLNAQRDPVEALALYRRALSLGGSLPLPQLFESAGVPFDLRPSAVRPLIDAVMGSLD